MAYSCTVTIPNFDKFNKKKKGEKAYWFRFEASTATSPEWLSLKPRERLLFVYLLSAVSLREDRVVTLDARRVTAHVPCRASVVPECVRRLADLGWIQILSENDRAATKCSTNERTNERTDERTNDPLRGHEKPAVPEAPASPPQLELLTPPTEKPKPPKPKPERPEGMQLVARYCELWKDRYKTQSSPPIRPQDAKNLKAIVSGSHGVPVARALVLLAAYFQMPDQWYVTKRHDIPTFLGNLNAVTQFAETGRMFSGREIRDLDENVAYENIRAELLAEIPE